MSSARLKAYFFLLIVTVIWAIANPVIKYTLGGISPALFLTYRFGIASLIALVFLLLGKFKFPKDAATRIELILQAFITTPLALGLLFFGLEKTTVLDSELITMVSPLIVSFAGVKFLNEHVTSREKAGMGVALVGTLLIIIEPFLQNHGSEIKFSGNVLIFLYIIAVALGAVLTKKLLKKGVDPLTMTNLSFMVGFFTFIPFTFNQIVGSGFTVLTNIPTSYHFGVLYMALLSGFLAYYLGNIAQKTVEIGEAAVFNYLYPVIAVPIAVLWLGEKITPIFIVGAIIITAGVFLAEIKKRRYN